jgi:ornithine cyclodeaminase
MAACIEACDRAFASYSRGGAEVPGVIHLDVPERSGEIHVKAGHLHGSPYYAVKVASGFPRNVELGLPTSDGMVVVFDSEDGAPGAFLLDQGYITDLRTGAAGGVAAKLSCAGADLDSRRDRNDLRARPGLPEGCSYEVSASVEDAVDGADVVITCTASRTALVRGEWLKLGAHVTAVGSDGPDKQELDPSVPARADLLVVDSREQCARIGEPPRAS